MHPVPARTAHSDPAPGFWTPLAGFVDDVYGTLARLFAYLMTLALLAAGGIALWDNLPTVVAAGNDAKLAELFAGAEIRCSDCPASGAPAPSADWVTGADNPRLRGPL
jgi:hypothetical protein